MKLSLQGLPQDWEAGIRYVARELNVETGEGGAPVSVEQRPGSIDVGWDGRQGWIRFADKIHFFRALGLFVEASQTPGPFSIVEEPQFRSNGAMFDVSRNAVLKVDSIKALLRRMALMGLNLFMLYSEDTYQVDAQPYFGYLRGRYSFAELKECDDYAFALGIEIVPCIQTLAHIEHFLKWQNAWPLRDTRDVLLIGDAQVYELIEQLVVAASRPFRSKRIHLGMDEAHGMGRGRSLDLHGQQDRFQMISSHLEKVLEITSRHSLKPMIWSDMYFRVGSPDHEYYDPESVIPAQVLKHFPKNLQLVYWDYYNEDEDFYRQFIGKHKAFGHVPLFSGGIWAWARFTPSYDKTFRTNHASLAACKEQGVQEVFATIWGDDGSEANIFSSLLGLQLYAEHGYARKLDPGKLKRRVKFCTGLDYDAFADLKYLDDIPGAQADDSPFVPPSNPSRFLLWQDLLLGVFDRHIEGLDLAGHYASLQERMDAYKLANSEWSFLFDVPEKLCAVLRVKGQLGLKITRSYRQRDYLTLEKIARNDLPALGRDVEALRLAHRAQWFSTYKPFGWEVLDIRYGGLAARIESATQRLSDFVAGRIDRIEELDEERLYFDGRPRPAEGVGLGFCDNYHRIASTGAFYHAMPF